jgi:hypothetical protein
LNETGPHSFGRSKATETSVTANVGVISLCKVSFLSLFKRTREGRGSVLVMVCTLVACVVLGMVTERKKAIARRLLDHMFHWFDWGQKKPQSIEQEAA